MEERQTAMEITKQMLESSLTIIHKNVFKNVDGQGSRIIDSVFIAKVLSAHMTMLIDELLEMTEKVEESGQRVEDITEVKKSILRIVIAYLDSASVKYFEKNRGSQ